MLLVEVPVGGVGETTSVRPGRTRSRSKDKVEEKVKNETKATIRCIPFDLGKETGKCMITGKPSEQRVLFARAY